MNMLSRSFHTEKPSYLNRLEREFSKLGGSGKKVAGFFSGGGGLDLGFSAAGFDVVYSSDIVEEYHQTIKSNIKGCDASFLDMNDWESADIPDNLTGIIGGPPCQSFSILGDRGSIDDPRGNLVFRYMELIAHKKPAFFLFENVPGIKSTNGGKDWNQIIQRFHDATGYKIYTTQLNAVNFGVPQKRERVFVIGFRDSDIEFAWPKATHASVVDNVVTLGLKPASTVEEAFSDIDGTLNHDKRVHGDRVRNRYSTIAPGSRDRADHTDRIRLDQPSGTVLVGSGGGGGRPFIHPIEHRHITVREAARLQSFPDWWNFCGGVTKQYRQVGNAVPPLLAKAIAQEIQIALR